ncbi:cyclic nucleotide-binding domain-containing protein [Nitrospinaceae bacterium]|nr:cyclic nucleotide-binding domain-containing protein [Nitrospinaceae bacterium]
MVEDSITKFVNTVPFFKGFSDVEKGKLISRADCFEKYSKEDVIFKQGDPGDTLFLVLQGKVALFRLGTIKVDEGRVSLKEEVDKKITILNPGSIFGEISMLTESRRNATARVESEQAVVMKITKKLIDGLNHPTQIKFHRQLLLALATHLDEMNAQFVDLQYKYDEDKQSIA